MQKYLHKWSQFTATAIALLLLVGCLSNNPHPDKDSSKNYYYTSFFESPKHLDPARSYAANEYQYIGLVYEPPFQYHYLKRPYQLTPLTTTNVPQPKYFDKNNKPLPLDAPEQKVTKAVYTITIRPGIMYQNHPCFAKNSQGNYIYRKLNDNDLKEINSITDFTKTGTRELTANDYVYQIKRLAHPQLACPILPIMAPLIKGLDKLHRRLQQEINTIRQQRKNKAGPLYNQDRDEKNNPIILNLNRQELEGARAIGRYTLQITLKKKYPQMLLWMTLPFFAPMPPEADAFYGQAALMKKNIDLQHWPVGTGPYRFEKYQSNRKIVLTKNENFNHEKYPLVGSPEDQANDLLQDAGKNLPFIDKIIFAYEKEMIPYWIKFLQGYYDASGIPKESFGKTISFDQGEVELNSNLQKKGITLATAVSPTIYYYGFNMLDPVVGGYSEKQQKLRQAISIALDTEESVRIFRNGRGISAMGPLAPGIPGYLAPESQTGINPYIYNWNQQKARYYRKSIKEAKKLLTEAGYPGGVGENGPLVLHYDSYLYGPDVQSRFSWLEKQFAKIGIQLAIRSTDYRQFQEKMDNGTAQIFSWGWNADYPDPENFLFLLYGPNRKARKSREAGGGENAANYANPDYDKLFNQMKAMNNGERRNRVIKRMTEIVRKDAPWIFDFHPVSFSLRHQWVANSKPLTMGNNKLKYLRLKPKLRQKLRQQWNQPVLGPIYLFIIIFLVGSLPAIISATKKAGQKRKAQT